jgi:hypothetical protein
VVTPILTAGLLAAVWVAPMRITLFGVIFLGLALDVAGESAWNSPVAPLGRLLIDNLNKTVPVNALKFPLLALVLAYLLVIHIHRLGSASRIDGVSHAVTARPMLWALRLASLTVIVLIALGVVMSGGDAQMAKIQLQNFVLLLLMAFLLMVSLRDMRDYRVLGGLILAAALIKALMGLWVWYTVHRLPAFATSHGDSMVFACAATILVARFAEKPARRNALLCLVILPLIGVGMIINNRRLVWIEVAASIFALYIMSRRTRLKLLVTRAALVALPALLLYLAAGWNAQSSFFAPVRLLHSVGDSDVDRSTWDRDVENFNLVYTLMENPFLGTGFGHPYDEVVKGDDISFFVAYRFVPHNSVLGLWCYGGLFGFTGLSVALLVGGFLAARSYHCAQFSDGRAAAFTSFAMVMVYQIQCWGDMGFSERKSIFLVSSALAVAGQLAVSTGAWDAGPVKAAVISRWF